VSDELYLVNAYTIEKFKGNPAAIVYLKSNVPDNWMKLYAQELNQPITTYVIEEQDGFRIRWFTPLCEINLCGHGTLGAAHILFEEHIAASPIKFLTKAGVLYAEQVDSRIKLTFKIKESESIKIDQYLMDLIDQPIKKAAWAEDRYILELDNDQSVNTATPNLDKIKKLSSTGIIITSISSDKYDFISRYFAPKIGIKEDYVTGSSHCALASYWKKELKKSDFFAYQASSRGGEINVSVKGDNVGLEGEVLTLFKGRLL